MVVLSSASAEGTSDEQSIAAAARVVIKRFFIGNNLLNITLLCIKMAI